MHSAYGTRLLSIGEIFDRAVHLTMSNLVPLATIVGLVIVPTRAIADWIDRDALARYFGVDGKIVADPRLLADYFALIRDPHPDPFWPGQIWFIVSLFPMALAFAAASIASQEFLNGEKTEFGASYRIAIRRLAPVIGANVLSFAMYVAAILAVGIPVLIVWFLILKAGGGATDSATVTEFAIAWVVVAVVIVWTAPLANCTTTGRRCTRLGPFGLCAKHGQ